MAGFSRRGAAGARGAGGEDKTPGGSLVGAVASIGLKALVRAPTPPSPPPPLPKLDAPGKPSKSHLPSLESRDQACIRAPPPPSPAAPLPLARSVYPPSPSTLLPPASPTGQEYVLLYLCFGSGPDKRGVC